VLVLSLKMNWNWESSSQYLAQAAHTLGGALVVFAAGVFFAEHGALWALGAGVMLAAIKEFVLDVAPPPYGEGDSWSDSLMDFCFYVIGGCAGFALFELAVYRHALVGT
jgi:hypothetical protein